MSFFRLYLECRFGIAIGMLILNSTDSKLVIGIPFNAKCNFVLGKIVFHSVIRLVYSLKSNLL